MGTRPKGSMEPSLRKTGSNADARGKNETARMSWFGWVFKL